MDEIDRRIINALQGGLPVCERPYKEAAEKIGLEEDVLIARLAALREAGVLTRIGPLFQIERMGGAFTLAALSVPEDRYDDVAARLSAMDEVAHNYRREHALNMWFVLATETPEGIDAAISRIEQDCDLPVHNFPKLREYFVELKLEA